VKQGPVKHLLVYADGRVEESRQPLEGLYFIKCEKVDGDLWNRKFEIHLAHDGLDAREPKTCSMVGLEVSFKLVETAADGARRRAEREAETMKKVLWGIRNYPGDKDDA
jgi:hypothetical protein